MRRVLPGIFTALSLLVLSACGSAPTPETVPEPAPQEPEAPPAVHALSLTAAPLTQASL